ncbi:hypothetical protein Hypma_008167 [Hypsizygus marmoreus]|uniref:Uncharacterized protein n=1 Tax=Hypsizygus marmoreus TaxID=39966 RepID=A0A369JVP0_HYPMA|nr:hypothetical protein Hypma_008167 [Hypsizygus marmoreus]
MFPVAGFAAGGPWIICRAGSHNYPQLHASSSGRSRSVFTNSHPFISPANHHSSDLLGGCWGAGVFLFATLENCADGLRLDVEDPSMTSLSFIHPVHAISNLVVYVFRHWRRSNPICGEAFPSALSTLGEFTSKRSAIATTDIISAKTDTVSALSC